MVAVSADYDTGGDILVADDRVASLKLLCDLLQAAGHRVRAASSGEDAWAQAQARAPELALLDVRMPGVDGFEVSRRFKAHATLKSVPVIFVSAQSDTEDKLRGFQAGGVDFIGKPFQSDEVLARVYAHIRLSRTQRALHLSNDALRNTLIELKQARDATRRAERLAALGALVAGIAHELNTPIGNCLLVASTLQDQLVQLWQQDAEALNHLSDEHRRTLGEVPMSCELLLRNLHRSAQLINSFKQLSADPRAYARSRFNVGDTLRDMGQLRLAALQRGGATLQLQLGSGLEVDSYELALSEIMSELVDNALIHGVSQGARSIVLTARALDERALELAVVDDGPGISPVHLERVFDPFFTTQMGHGRGGLGLNIVHNLASTVLGGDVGVESALGRTCFWLRMPRVAPRLR